MAINKLNYAADTICALSTPMGRSALAVIRLSGPLAFETVQQLARDKFKRTHKEAQFLRLFNSQSDPLDEVVATYYESPNSYTGEELVEICCHGNPEIVKQIMAEIVSHETREAEPGEFSRRAVTNGKMSLSELESLAWLIEANNSKSIGAALRAKFAGLGVPIQEAKQEIESLVAEVEARLDFPEHEVEEIDRKNLSLRLETVKRQFQNWIRVFESHQRQLQRPLVVIAGPPNSGKSSLFNQILGLEKSIVFNQPGTTRDQVEAELVIEGRSFTFVDTAGIHESSNPIELLGIEKSRRLMEAADLIVWVSAGMKKPPGDLKEKFAEKAWICVSSKADEFKPEALADLSTQMGDRDSFERLESLIFERLKEEVDSENILFSDRQASQVKKAISNIETAKQRLDTSELLEWVAESLREAFRDLGEILGEIPHQNVLDKVLSKFCIGK